MGRLLYVFKTYSQRYGCLLDAFKTRRNNHNRKLMLSSKSVGCWRDLNERKAQSKRAKKPMPRILEE